MAVNSVELSNVAVRFGTVTAVQNVSLAIEDATFVSVVGPTGCGKSTLLNIITGLLQPAEGSVQIFGRPLRGLNDISGYMLQQEALLPWKTVEDNVGLGLVFQGLSIAEARRKSEGWLAKVGLKDYGKRYLHQLSGGQKKRVAMAQTLIVEPKIVLMDEPFSALDVHTRRLMHRLLLDLWQEERRTVVFITHDLEEAITLADRVIVLSAGPAARPIADIPVTLPRPRDVSALVTTDEFMKIYREIWGLLGEEVEKSYARQ